MAIKIKHKYLGVVLATQESIVIEATSQEAAKKQMKKLHGDEYTKVSDQITQTNWVCARQPGD